MTWGEGHQWSLECSLPQQTFEFKIVVFEGHGVRWEGGCNRVVQAGADEGDVPVEIVVWLTCNFDATAATQLQLAVPRASVLDAYETGKATLEFLKRRRAKLGQDSEQASSAPERTRTAAELARLAAAVAEQSSTVTSLADILGADVRGTAPQARRPAGQRNGNGIGNGDGNGAHVAEGNGRAEGQGEGGAEGEGEGEADDAVLLLAIDSVALPPVLRRISFANVMLAWSERPSMLSAGSGSSEDERAVAVEGLEGAAGPAAAAPPSAPSAAAPGPSPFVRGELDVRAEELMDAAGALLAEMRAPAAAGSAAGADSGAPAPALAGRGWAMLAEEASQVAGALEAIGAGQRGGEAEAQLRQLQGLASVGSALAERADGAAAAAAEAAASFGGERGVAVDGTAGAAATVVEAAGGAAPVLVACLEGSVSGDSAALGVEAAAAPAAVPQGQPRRRQREREGPAVAAAVAAAASGSGGGVEPAGTEAAPLGGVQLHAPQRPPPPSSPRPLEEELHSASPPPPWQRMAASIKARLKLAPAHARRATHAARTEPLRPSSAPQPPHQVAEPLAPQPPAAVAEPGQSPGGAQPPASTPQAWRPEENGQPRRAPPKFNMGKFLGSLFR